MNTFAPDAGYWSLFLLQVTVKVSLLLALLYLLDLAFGSKRAAWRNLLWKMGLVGTLLVPLTAASTPAVSVSVPYTARHPAVQAVVAAMHEEAHLRAMTGAGRPTAAPTAPAFPVSPAPDRASFILVLYAVGAGFFLLQTLAGLAYVARFKRTLRAITSGALQRHLHNARARFGIRRGVGLCESKWATTPLQLGALRPCIVLPPAITGQNQIARDAVLHELAHVRRWDYAFNLVGGLARALFWFNPLVWLAVRRLHATGEQACDDWAVQLAETPDTYAESLIAVSARLKRATPWLPGVAMARHSQTRDRIRRIIALAGDVSPRPGRLAALALACALALGGGFLAASALRAKFEFEPKSISRHSELLTEIGREMAAGGACATEATCPELFAALANDDSTRHSARALSRAADRCNEACWPDPIAATARRQMDRLNQLLSAGADPDTACGMGRTALHYAMRGNALSTFDNPRSFAPDSVAVGLLLAVGADPNRQDRMGQTPLMRAAHASGPPVIRQLLAAGADLECEDYYGRTALHYAAHPLYRQTALLLLKAGADPNAADWQDQTALMIAAENSYEHSSALQTARYLLRHGARVDAQNHLGQTALMIAVVQGDELLVREILAYGADPDIKNGKGATALMLSRLGANRAIDDLLVAAGADEEARDDGGRSAADYALAMGR